MLRHRQQRLAARASATSSPSCMRERVVGADAARSEKLSVRRAGCGMAATSGSSRLITAGVAAREDARLGGRVGSQAGVAVEMIGRHVEHGRAASAATRWSRAGSSTARARTARAASSSSSSAGSPRLPPTAHLHARRAAAMRAEQRRHGALAVGAGDADHRRVRGAREQLDVADDLEAAAPRLVEERAASSATPGRDHHAHAPRRAARRRGRRGAPGFAARARRAPRRAFRRLRRALSVTASRQPCAQQIARARRARSCRAPRPRRTWLARGAAHRSFSVDRPASTSSSEMIQKRTITFGSAQPLSSK